MKIPSKGSANKALPLYTNVFAVSWECDKSIRSVGLYDGDTDKAIHSGKYYFYLNEMPINLNFYLTGDYLCREDKENAVPFDLSTYGSNTPIFGGYVDSHMGHFFIEVLARGIDFTAYKDNPVIFLILRGERADRKTFLKYCQFFGLDEKRVVFVEKPTFISKMYIPNAQFFITSERIKKVGPSQYAYENTRLSTNHIPAEYFSDQFLDVHRMTGDKIRLRENTDNRILYLSRVNVKDCFGEEVIHNILEENGHVVICPEEHSWRHVISLVRKHSHVVGMRGSAMHFLLFCRRKKRVTYFGAAPLLHHNFYNLEQMMQNDASYVEVRMHELVGMPRTKNLLRFDDMLSLLAKLGISCDSGNYLRHYNTKIVPEYLEFWRRWFLRKSLECSERNIR